MARLLLVPYLGTAEDDVLLSHWAAAEGDAVRQGQTLATVETLKASFAVEAEADGVLLRRLVPAGERVAVRAALGLLGEAGERIDERALAALLEESAAATAEAPTPDVPLASLATAPPLAPEPPAAPAARRRAAELGVELATLRGSGPGGLIRMVDVERAAAVAAQSGAAPGDGTLDPAFLAFLRSDGEAFARLSSDFRVALYRRHGARIADGCRLGPGTLLRAERIVLGANASFGPDCSLEARELVAGELLHFGARCRIRCTRLRFGDNAYFTDDVEIGGGGAMDPEAELVVGSHGFVGEHVHLNPCRPLRLGDEVVLSRNAVVMTHSFGGSLLQGYPNRFAGVTLGDGAQVGIGAVLFPGVELGAGSILLSGSSLVTSVPPRRLFGGVPAVDLKAAATPLAPSELAARARELVLELARQLELRGFALQREEAGDELRITVVCDGRRHVLRFSPRPFAPLAADPAASEEVRVAPRYERAAWESLPPTVVGIDLTEPAIRGPLGPLAAALRELLRKRGVRLHPRSWAYRGGWL